MKMYHSTFVRHACQRRTRAPDQAKPVFLGSASAQHLRQMRATAYKKTISLNDHAVK